MADYYTSKPRKAAKQHKCCECGDKIENGELYMYTSGVWGGRPASFKQCLTCNEIMIAAYSVTDFVDEGPVLCGLRDWFGDFKFSGQDDLEWLNEMAKMINKKPEKLNKLLKVHGQLGD